MSSDNDQIFLVTAARSQWVEKFTQTAGVNYRVSELAHTDLTSAHGASPAKGVVVFYGDSTEGTQWLEQLRACVHYADLPVIAVAHKPTAAMRAQLIAAGASTVCDAESEPEVVISEVENRCNVEPVMESLRTQVLEPFIDATLLTLREMASAQAQVHTVYRKLGYRIFGDYSALVGLKAGSEGTLVISFPAQTAHELSRRLLAPLGAEVTEELVQSCMGEIANIVVGQAKGKLAATSYRFAMSTPTVVSGPNHEIKYKQGLPCLVASFTGDVGDFSLQICMAF